MPSLELVLSLTPGSLVCSSFLYVHQDLKVPALISDVFSSILKSRKGNFTLKKKNPMQSQVQKRWHASWSALQLFTLSTVLGHLLSISSVVGALSTICLCQFHNVQK